MRTPATVVARIQPECPTASPRRRSLRGWAWPTGWVAGLAVALVVVVTVGVSVGSVWMAPAEVWSVIGRRVLSGMGAGNVDSTLDAIVWELRLPRVLLAAVVGASLGVVGAVLQAVVRNPLADPYILGSTAGASLGAVLVIVGGFGALSAASVPVGAFLGALAAFGVVLVLGRSNGQVSPAKLILVGVAVGAAFSALTSYVVIGAPDDEEVRGALFWLLGTLAGARWPQLGLPTGLLLVVLCWLCARGPQLNALAIGDETATTLGINVHRLRLELIILSALLVATAVALSGGIGFVALMLPHIARLLVGVDHRRMLPVVALLGAVFLVCVDIGTRMLLSPLEIPAGVITALLGGPVMLYLLWRRETRLRQAT